jgi:hypothetical protein
VLLVLANGISLATTLTGLGFFALTALSTVQLLG